VGCIYVASVTSVSNDGIGVGSPDEWFRAGVVIGEVPVDRSLEVDEGTEHATLQAAAGELGEETFNGIEPGRRGGGEVEGPARMAASLALTLGCVWLP